MLLSETKEICLYWFWPLWNNLELIRIKDNDKIPWIFGILQWLNEKLFQVSLRTDWSLLQWYPLPWENPINSEIKPAEHTIRIGSILDGCILQIPLNLQLLLEFLIPQQIISTITNINNIHHKILLNLRENPIGHQLIYNNYTAINPVQFIEITRKTIRI